MHLDEIKPGKSCMLLDIDCGTCLRRRLMEMGLTPGTSVSVVRTAPLGDPIELKVRGYRLSLRRGEAAHILCECA